MSIRTIARALVCLLPMTGAKRRLMRLVGYTVAADAGMGACLVWNVDRIVLEPGSAIGLGNVFRDVREVSFAEGARMGQWNWVSCAIAFPDNDLSRTLVLGRESGITSRHYLDTSGGISIGEFSVIGGMRTTVMTHGVDFMRSTQRTAPVTIGAYSLINTNCVLVAGTTIEDRVVVGAHSLVTRTLERDGLYMTAPATRVRDIGTAAFFTRPHGYIETTDLPGGAKLP